MNLTRASHASFRDRTEFCSVVESAHRHAIPSSSSAAASSSSSRSGGAEPLDGSIAATLASSEFNNRAFKIGPRIHQTSQKLARLANVCFAFCLPPPVPLDFVLVDDKLNW
jgi:syntaxin 5